MKKQILVAFSVVSPLHLVNVLSVFMNNQQKYDEFIINLTTYWDKSIIPDRYLEYCRHKNIRVLENENIYTLLSHDSTYVEYSFIFINNCSIRALLLSINKLTINEIFFVDEGISTYSSLQHMVRAIYREQGKTSVVKYLIRCILEPIILCFFRKKIHSFHLFDKKTLLVNTVVKENSTKVLQELCSLRVTEDIQEIKIVSTMVLYCSQPWIELGVKSIDEYAQELLEIQTKVENKGYQFIVKKHPVDNIFEYDRYNIQVLDFDGIVEEYVANNNVIALISVSSTSSLSCSVLFGTKSYISGFSAINKLGSQLKKLFRKYCYDFKDFR